MSLLVRRPLTIVPDIVTYCESNLALRDAVRVMPGGRGGCGARGQSLISFAPGRSGHHACRHYDRHARCVAGCGLSRRRSDPRPLDGSPTKPGPDRTKGRHTPWAEPWWNAGRRARPIAEGRRKPLLPWRDPRAVCVREVLPAFAGVPLPLFSSLRPRAERGGSNPVRPLSSGLLRRFAPRNDARKALAV